jgi:hypothetical protein
MNTKTGTLMMLVVLLMFCLFSLEQSAFAQSPNSDCKEIRANSLENIGDVSTFTDVGTFTNGGILNGTTEYVWDPATGSVIVTDPNVVSYFTAFTLTTRRGQLKAQNVYIYNFVTGLWISMAHINPDTSTGRFAGAMGIVYFNGRTVGVFPDSSYPSDITAQICFRKTVWPANPN